MTVKRTTTILIAGLALMAVSPFRAVAEGDAPEPEFEKARKVCDAGQCAVFAALSDRPVETLAPLSLDTGRSYATTGDGVNLVDVGLGGLAGAIIGDEIGGPAEAVVFSLLGAGLALGGVGKDIDEEDAHRRADAWRRGDDMVYNPAHPLPTVAHWLGPRKK